MYISEMGAAGREKVDLALAITSHVSNTTSMLVELYECLDWQSSWKTVTEQGCFKDDTLNFPDL